MTGKHWAVIGALIGAIGLQLAGASHGWVDVVSPTFLGGVLIQTGATVAALFADPPSKDRDADSA